MSKPPRRVFGDFPIDCLSRADLVAACLADCAARSGRAKLVVDANGHALSLARTDARYRAAIAQADLIHADGGFLVSLSKHLPGAAIPERSATTDMIHDFAARFAQTGHSFYLLGADEATNAACAERLVALYPGLRIVGRHHGFFREAEQAALFAEIAALAPDVIWVGLGKPLEQAVGLRLRDRVPAAWIITCGGCFNYVTGAYPRAPQWMQDWNLEWLHRLASDPRKLFWRYLVTSPHALWIALRSGTSQPE